LNYRQRIAPYIVDPMHSYKVAWDVLIALVYMVAYSIDPYILAFHQVLSPLSEISNVVGTAIFVDILTTPFVGVIRKENILPIKKKKLREKILKK